MRGYRVHPTHLVKGRCRTEPFICGQTCKQACGLARSLLFRPPAFPTSSCHRESTEGHWLMKLRHPSISYLAQPGTDLLPSEGPGRVHRTRTPRPTGRAVQRRCVSGVPGSVPARARPFIRLENRKTPASPDDAGGGGAMALRRLLANTYAACCFAAVRFAKRIGSGFRTDRIVSIASR